MIKAIIAIRWRRSCGAVNQDIMSGQTVLYMRRLIIKENNSKRLFDTDNTAPIYSSKQFYNVKWLNYNKLNYIFKGIFYRNKSIRCFNVEVKSSPCSSVEKQKHLRLLTYNYGLFTVVSKGVRIS